LYVSDDSNVWHRAEFGKHRIEEDAYTTDLKTDTAQRFSMIQFRLGALGIIFEKAV
jgi:hypothetical protein